MDVIKYLFSARGKHKDKYILCNTGLLHLTTAEQRMQTAKQGISQDIKVAKILFTTLVFILFYPPREKERNQPHKTVGEPESTFAALRQKNNFKKFKAHADVQLL